MLLPVDMQEWLPKNHLVHFIVDAVEMMDVRSFKTNESGSGDAQFSPQMMAALLFYGVSPN
jgi:transposase